MVWSDFWAETSSVCFRMVLAVGMAMSMRMTMMEITMRSSIWVNPSSRAKEERARARRCLADFKNVQFIWFQSSEGRRRKPPTRQILQPMDAGGEGNAQRQGVG